MRRRVVRDRFAFARHSVPMARSLCNRKQERISNFIFSSSLVYPCNTNSSTNTAQTRRSTKSVRDYNNNNHFYFYQPRFISANNTDRLRGSVGGERIECRQCNIATNSYQHTEQRLTIVIIIIIVIIVIVVSVVIVVIVNVVVVVVVDNLLRRTLETCRTFFMFKSIKNKNTSHNTYIEQASTNALNTLDASLCDQLQQTRLLSRK